jgi:UDP-GlcNAc:undecaprenyl-phosphate GlcNAc-1-phosphate transferase
LVLTVSLSEGPLISIQSLILSALGLITIILLFSNIAKIINLVDRPDIERKDHHGTIPLVGGIGLYISFIYGAFVYGVNPFYLYLLGSLIPIMITGVIDGIQGFSINPVYRVIAQIIASWIIIITTDIYIKDLGNLLGLGTFYLGQLGIPFTIFSVVGISNAFNMLDGKDGILGSVVVVIMSSLLLLLYLNNTIYQWAQIVILGTLVYLAFNLNLFGQKRKIFLGDHGSVGLGYIVAWSLIYLAQESNQITPASALWFVLLPLADALLTFLRRLKSSQSVFAGDKLHFHHRLSDQGFSDRMILFICSLITVFACIFAVASNIFDFEENSLFYGFITLLIILILLGFIRTNEFDTND